MPRYFFHVMDGRALVDAEGTELAGLDEVRAEAIRTAGEMLADKGMLFWKGTAWQMTVADEAGDTVLTLRFSADDHGRSATLP
jgi:hypothetical protein